MGKAPEKTIFLGNVIATKDNLLGEEFIEYIKNDSSDNSKQQKGIRVHDSGARVTNKSKANELSDKTPQSFREVQSLLTATDDYLSSDRKDSELSNVHGSIQNLEEALRSDGYNKDDNPAEKMISYLSLFSDAFPNWQPEYRELNKIIPEYFNQSNSNQ